MLIGGGGGWDAITGNTYQIKTMAVPPASAGGMTASDIEKLFSYLDPSAVAEAGKAHTAAAKTLQSIADSLVTHAQALAGGWSGPTAQASITAFRQLHQTAVQLAQASAQTGQVLTWLGETILPYYKNWKAPSNGVMGTIESWFGSNPQDSAAQQVMQRLNDRLSQANAALPASVSISLPKIGQAGRAPVTAGGGGSGRGAGQAAGGVGLTSAVGAMTSPVSSSGGVRGVQPGGAGVSGGSPGGSFGVVPTGSGGSFGAAPTVSGGTTVSPTHLASIPPGGGAPGSVGSLPGGPGGGPGGVGVPGGTAPGGLAGGPGPIGSGPGVGVGPGPGGGPGFGGEPPSGVGVLPGEPGGTGDPGAGAVGSPAGGSGVAGEDVGFLPGESAAMGSDGMIGTGPGMAEGESEVGSTGATGFVGADDAATQPGDQVPATAGSSGGRRENERYRQSWMAEDIDLWEGAPVPAASP